MKGNGEIGKKLGIKWVPLVHCYLWKDGEVGVVEERMVKGGESLKWLEDRVGWFLEGGFVESEWGFEEGL